MGPSHRVGRHPAERPKFGRVFLQAQAAFQTWPTVPVVLVGSLSVLIWMSGKSPQWMKAARLAVAGWSAALIPLAIAGMADVPRHWLSVDRQAAAELEQVTALIPPGAELVASQGIIGRCTRTTQLYDFWALGQDIPVHRAQVIFLLAREQGASPTPSWQTKKAILFVSKRLRAKRLVARHGVFEFVWTVPQGTRRVTIS